MLFLTIEYFLKLQIGWKNFILDAKWLLVSTFHNETHFIFITIQNGISVRKCHESEFSKLSTKQSKLWEIVLKICKIWQVWPIGRKNWLMLLFLIFKVKIVHKTKFLRAQFYYGKRQKQWSFKAFSSILLNFNNYITILFVFFTFDTTIIKIRERQKNNFEGGEDDVCKLVFSIQ